jgi:hypothetical protein
MPKISPDWEEMYPYFDEMLREYLTEETGQRIQNYRNAPIIETHNAIRSYYIRKQTGLIRDKKGNLNPDREGMVVNHRQFVDEAERIIREEYFKTAEWTTSRGNKRYNIYQKGRRGMLHSFNEEQFSTWSVNFRGRK